MLNEYWVYGLGLLGLPCTVALVQKAHTVYGFDVNKQAIDNYKKGISNLYELDINRLLKEALPRMHFVDSIAEVVSLIDIMSLKDDIISE
ncbi:MAG: hypothetical protein AAB267_01710 [Candidatus Desantisbacteria bacterium]